MEGLIFLLHHPSFSFTVPLTGIQSLRLKLNIFWIKFTFEGKLHSDVGPAAFGQRCTCGSDLAILVQTEVWSSPDETFLAAERGFCLT